MNKLVRSCPTWRKKKGRGNTRGLVDSRYVLAGIVVVVVMVVVVVVGVARGHIGVRLVVVIGARVAIRQRPVIVVALEIADAETIVSEVVASQPHAIVAGAARLDCVRRSGTAHS